MDQWITGEMPKTHSRTPLTSLYDADAIYWLQDNPRIAQA